MLRNKYWRTHNLFSSNSKKVKRIDKNEEEITKTISTVQRFMASSLPNLVDNLSERIYKIKCINCNKFCIEYTNFKDGFNTTQMFMLQ